ncbi:exo-beta-N-acetylmuramidase NamZ family protein [Vibrio metschnikovii]|uniref:exo-beta-N-acetylmuramidase NamZ family protein n=1 Tax=Vibrio metschnikovii TaxID=28172 RepID=UPI00164BDF59|nr:DUF1343 domain-containing protein [Vibrio metschnikovii]MBC5833176.1 DUF1343 domain-containing protein [Vibrio metschnikovii]
MKIWFKTILTLIMSIGLLACNSDGSNQLQLGVDRQDIYGPLLAGKNVGLMVNQSSLDSKGTHTIDKLVALESRYNFKVTTLFAVEHGIRGDKEAGEGDNDHIDDKTGLPIISLYGSDNGRPRARPTEDQLSNVDIVIYDLQDVGVRFFTYTISMHRMMESIQAYGKAFMVFDRPNPNGDYVYGPLLEEENVSGIGIHPIPMVHGLTSGELATMIVGQGWLTGVDEYRWSLFGAEQYRLPVEKLHVITMKNYTHQQPYSLPINPSPNLATDLAIRLYPALGLFEATSVNMGRGSSFPHEQLGFPDPSFYINTQYHIDPSITAYGWPQGGKTVYGERFNYANPQHYRASIKEFVRWWLAFQHNAKSLAVAYDQEANYLDYQESHFVIRPAWLAKLIGTKSFLADLQSYSKEVTELESLVKKLELRWQKDLDDYRYLYNKYKIYL